MPTTCPSSASTSLPSLVSLPSSRSLSALSTGSPHKDAKSGPDESSDVNDKQHRADRWEKHPSRRSSHGSETPRTKHKSSHKSTRGILRKPSPPDNVPPYLASGKLRVTEKPHGFSPSVLTVASQLSTSSSRSDESNSTLTQQSYDKQRAEQAGVNDPNSPLSLPSQRVGTHHERYSAPEQAGPRSPETATKPDATTPGEGFITASPSYSMSSGLGSSESPDTPSSRSTAPPFQGSILQGPEFQGDKPFVISPGMNRPHPPQIHSGLSMFHTPGPQRIDPGAEVPHKYPLQSSQPLQSPQHDVRLENQEQALHDYIALFGQRPPQHENEQMASPQPEPPWWWHQPQVHRINPQTKGPGFPGVPQHHEPFPRQTWPPAPISPKPNAPNAFGFRKPNRTTSEGYELLATKLADTTFGTRPIYRSFEVLNHRILLFLQDEICEHEAELRKLDECIAQTGQGHGEDDKKPESRRAEAHLSPSEGGLHFRRKYILGEIFVKMERYYRVLETYRNVSQDMYRPKERELATYRKWMSENRPIDDAEADFLRHEQDLMVLPRRKFETSIVTASAAGVPFMLLLPLVAFAVIPNFLGRVFTIAVVTMTQWMIGAAMDVRHFMTIREWIACTGLYVTFMALVAAVAR